MRAIGSVRFAISLVSLLSAVSAFACDGANYYPRSWSASCDGQVTPSQAVVSGSVSASGNQLVHNRDEVNRQIDEIKKLVTPLGGELSLRDLNRNFAEANAAMYGGMLPGAPSKSFITTQAFDILLKKNADIDTIVDKLNALGTVSFGRNSTFNDPRMKSFVRFRVTDGPEQLDKLLESCKERAIADGCKASGEEPATCAASARKRATVSNFNLQSQPVATEWGQNNPVTLYYPGQTSQLTNLELAGDIVLKLSGSVTLQVPPQSAPSATEPTAAQVAR